MKKLIASALAAAVLLIVITAAAWINEGRKDEYSGNMAVSLNEIQKLCEQGDTEGAAQAASVLREQTRIHDQERDCTVPVMCCICLVFLSGVCLYTAKVIIMPFEKLSDFAQKVALGDFSVPLVYDRTNLFGKFTWAFDCMRNEIGKARACEREAIENNKTVIASLSHDIKTPVASVKAYAEALEMGIGTSAEKQQEYIDVIIKKCDEISKITDDIFTHSLTELGRLKMSPERFEITAFLKKTVEGLSADGRVHFDGGTVPLYVYADRSRIAQVAENLINNARKYAGTDMYISVVRYENTVQLHFRDEGKGIPDEDMPFVTSKFYRGKNCGDENGTGLGLYIVKYIVSQSDGKLELVNLPDGFEAVVSLPLDLS